MRKKIALVIMLNIVMMFMAMSQSFAQDIPDSIYQWVLATPRVSYYFNKQQMKYEVQPDGMADTNVLIVPILEQYDWLEKEDIIDKRRWNNQSVEQFGDLWGFCGTVRIDMRNKTVTYLDEAYLNSWWTPILTFEAHAPLNLEKMSQKNIERIFFSTIVDYAQANRMDLLERQKDVINPQELAAAGIKVKPIVKHPMTEREKVEALIKAYNKKDAGK